MKLTYNKIHRANTIFMFLRKQKIEYLENQNISECEKCGGVGLSNINTEYNSWDGSSYCDECNGVGYKGIKESGMQVNLFHYLCRRCGGLGCSSCDEGIVDWIDHSMGR